MRMRSIDFVFLCWGRRSIGVFCFGFLGVVFGYTNRGGCWVLFRGVGRVVYGFG